MKEKPNTDIVEDAEELRKWRCLKVWRRKSWTSTRANKAKEMLSEVEVLPWNGGGGYAKTRDTE